MLSTGCSAVRRGVGPLIAIVAVGRHALVPVMGVRAPLLPYIFAVFAAALLGEFGPAIVARLGAAVIATVLHAGKNALRTITDAMPALSYVDSQQRYVFTIKLPHDPPGNRRPESGALLEPISAHVRVYVSALWSSQPGPAPRTHFACSSRRDGLSAPTWRRGHIEGRGPACEFQKLESGVRIHATSVGHGRRRRLVAVRSCRARPARFIRGLRSLAKR